MHHFSAKDQRYMRLALDLAARGRGRVHPNPMVGAVLVKNGRVIGRGFHRRFGGPHAEAEAVRRAGKSAEGATLYVTLEPCAHTGKTPPCAEDLIRRKIRTVVIGAHDPHPLVRGKGIRRLKRAGVSVRTGLLEKEAAELNKDYLFWIRRRIPYAVAKIAQSLDGKIATAAGESKWITGERARRLGHALRSESDAILVGSRTVLRDNPLLSARGQSGRPQPLKVVLDSRLRVRPDARLFSRKSGGSVLLAVTSAAGRARGRRFAPRTEIVRFPKRGGRVDLAAVFRYLGRRGIVRVLIEGGGELLGDAFARKLVREVYWFVAPKVIGGRKAPTSVGGRGAGRLAQAANLRDIRVLQVGPDVLIHGEI